jgi:hypothetical protein
MTAAPMPRPATIRQAAGWWLVIWMFQAHISLCRWHMKRAEALEARCPWLTWGRRNRPS